MKTVGGCVDAAQPAQGGEKVLFGQRIIDSPVGLVVAARTAAARRIVLHAHHVEFSFGLVRLLGPLLDVLAEGDAAQQADRPAKIFSNGAHAWLILAAWEWFG